MITSNISVILKSFRKRKINFIILILQSIILGLLIGMFTNVVGSLNNYKEEMNLITKDIYKVQTFPNVDRSTVSDMFYDFDLEFEELSQTVLSQDNKIKGNEENIFIRTQHINNELDLIVEGKFPTQDNEVSLGIGYALSNNIKLGDPIKIEEHSFEVVGLYQNPEEYQLYDLSISSNISLKDNMPAIVTENALIDLGHKVNICYYSHLETDDIKSLLNDSRVLSVKEIDLNIINTLADSNMQLLIMSSLMIVFTILIAVFLQVRSIIVDNKASIGVLISMGIKPIDITLSYSIFGILTFILVLCGTLLGDQLGNSFLEVLSTTYNMSIKTSMSNDISMYVVISLILSFSIGIIVVYYVSRLVRQTPLMMIKGTKEAKSTKSNSLSKPWVPIKIRLQLININTNKVMSLLFNFSTIVSIFLFQFSMSLTKSTETLISDYDLLLNYEVKSYLDMASYDYEENNKLLFYETTGKVLKNTSTSKDIMSSNVILALEPNNHLINFSKDNIQPIRNNEIVIPISFAQENDINLSDKILFVIDSYDIELKVVGINSVYLDNTIYISTSTVDRIHSEVGISKVRNGIFLDDDHALISISKDEILTAGESLTESIKTITVFLQCFSVFIFVLTMIMFSGLLIDKHRKEITLLVAEGYSYLQSVKMFTSYFNILIIISGVFTCMLSPVLLSKISIELSKTVGYNLILKPSNLLLIGTTTTGLIIFNLYLILNYLKNKNMNLEKILKSEE